VINILGCEIVPDTEVGLNAADVEQHRRDAYRSVWSSVRSP